MHAKHKIDHSAASLYGALVRGEPAITRILAPAYFSRGLRTRSPGPSGQTYARWLRSKRFKPRFPAALSLVPRATLTVWDENDKISFSFNL